jgi:hypothetical protein
VREEMRWVCHEMHAFIKGSLHPYLVGCGEKPLPALHFVVIFVEISAQEA